jgi:hypothetical protein
LFIKGQTLVNLQSQGALTEKQIQTEIQRAILTAAEASGKKIDNRIASETADSLIKAANASNELQYRDSTYDYKNVKLRKHTEYKTSMANQKAAEYGARRVIGIIHTPHLLLPITLNLRLLCIKRVLFTHHTEINLILMILINHTDNIVGKVCSRGSYSIK